MVPGLILLLGIAIQCRGASNVDVMSALQDIYTALDGPGWKWASIDPSQREWNFTMNNGQYVDIDQACDWAGIACNDSRVLGISSINSLVLSGPYGRGVNLRGTLPSTVFSHLTTLEVLKLRSFGLSGTIPEQITELTNLATLTLSECGLSGSLPAGLVNMSRLEYLEIEDTSLSGVLPQFPTGLKSISLTYNSIGGTLRGMEGLVLLESLDLDGNALTGQLNFSSALPSLTYLSLSRNYLTTWGPHSPFASLPNIDYIYLDENELRVNLTESTFVGIEQVGSIDLEYNLISGRLPSSLISLTKLTDLDLRYNMLTGPVCILSNLTTLEYFGGFGNQLTGTLPELTFSSVLNMLQLGNNSLTGTIPSSYMQLDDMSHLDLGGNSLTGTIPHAASEGFQYSFDVLGLQSNQLSGTIPDWVWSPDIGLLSLSSNQLTGTIPAFPVSPDVMLYAVYLYDNKLSGTLPENISPYLSYFSAAGNALSGSIPETYFNSTYISTLSLEDNSFHGSIPDVFREGDCYLQHLTLFSNSLTGTLPSSLRFCGSLSKLMVHRNLLGGSIDADTFNASGELRTLLLHENDFGGDLGFLERIPAGVRVVSLDSNNFVGALPTQVFNSTALQVFSAGSNCLEGTLSSTVCAAKNLDTLAVPSMASGEGCRTSFWDSAPAFVPDRWNAYFTKRSYEGPVPSCIFNELNLSVLMLGSNGLTGDIGHWNISRSLQRLSLSNNMLEGTLPPSLKRVDNLVSLDLSDNRNIHGSLLVVGNTPGVDENSAVSLSMNHLSGPIPTSLLNLNDVDILTGNVFDCHGSLPANDPRSSTYACGSSTIDIPFVTYFCVCLACTVVIGAILVCQGSWKYQIKVMQEWFRFCDVARVRLYDKHREVYEAMDSMKAMRRNLTEAGGVGLLLLLAHMWMWQSGMGFLETPYWWITTSVNLRGDIAAYLNMALISILLASAFYAAMRDREESLSAAQNRLGMPSARTGRAPKGKRGRRVQEQELPLSTKVSQLLVLTLYLSAAMSVIIIGNVLYVYIIRTSSIQVRYVAVPMTAFKAAWSFCVREILIQSTYMRSLTGLDHKDSWVIRAYTRRSTLFLSIEYWGRLLVPVVTFIFISPLCLKDIFVGETDSYSFSVHTDDNSLEDYIGGDEDLIRNIPVDISVQRPFTYEYSCTMGLISTYTAVFMYQFVFKLGYSTLYFIMIYIRSCDSLGLLDERTDKMVASGVATSALFYVVPKLVWTDEMFVRDGRLRGTLVYKDEESLDPLAQNGTKRNIRYIVSAALGLSLGVVVKEEPPPYNHETYSISVGVALLIVATFGAVSPLLSIVVTISMMIENTLYQTMIGSFLATSSFVEGEGEAAEIEEATETEEAIARRREETRQRYVRQARQKVLEALKLKCSLPPATLWKSRYVFFLLCGVFHTFSTFDTMAASRGKLLVPLVVFTSVIIIAEVITRCGRSYLDNQALTRRASQAILWEESGDSVEESPEEPRGEESSQDEEGLQMTAISQKARGQAEPASFVGSPLHEERAAVWEDMEDDPIPRATV